MGVLSLRGGAMSLLVSCSLLSLLLPTVGSISCYTCTRAKSNDECSMPEHLTDCEDRFDVCQTEVAYPGKPDEQITKKCGVGPCALETNQQNVLGLDCSGGGQPCIQCCLTAGCNISSANRQSRQNLASLMLLPGVLVTWLLSNTCPS